MHIVIFGLCVSSSWGNGHATLWRGLLKALARRGHTVVFYEKDVPYYAAARDGWQTPDGIRLQLYGSAEQIVADARRELAHADLALFTSYCPDADMAARLILDSAATLKAFYDLDTPVTLQSLRDGQPIAYLPRSGIASFDFCLSYAGGQALNEVKARLDAPRVFPLYGWVDPETHAPAAGVEAMRADLSYLGTYAADRQQSLDELFVEPARQSADQRFILAGAQYPDELCWPDNVQVLRHVSPALHPAFFCSSRATLKITRAAMARNGFCPSGRLFEASACGVPILTDVWAGLELFFDPLVELYPVRASGDVSDVLSLNDLELGRAAEAARARTLRCHTADQRAKELEAICDCMMSSQASTTDADRMRA